MSTRTTEPMVTGTSVLGVRYNGGVMLLSDTLGSYGSMAMFKRVPRLKRVNSETFIGFSGDVSDYQFLSETLFDLTTNDFVSNDGIELSPKEIYNFIHRLYYQNRNKFNPLWNQILVAGYDKKEKAPFLGFVDLNGTHFQDKYIATGFGQHLALPMMRKGYKEDLSENEAKSLLEESMKILIYRDCRTINSFTIGKVSEKGVELNWHLSGNESERENAIYSLATQWKFKRFQFPDNNKIEGESKNEEKKENEEKKMDEVKR